MKGSKGEKSVEVSRETKKMYIICICCILVAMIARLVSKQSQAFSSNALVCAAFSAATFLWMLQVKNRVIHPEERKYMIMTGAMIVFLIVIRTIKYNYLLEGSTEERYLWYLYYIPQTFTALFLFFTVLHIGRPMGRPISRWWKLLYLLAAGICGGILTNDFHQMAFRFPGGLTEEAAFNYIHGPLYFVSVIWLVVLFGAILGIVFSRCAVPANRGRIWMPVVPLMGAVIYCVAFFIDPDNILQKMLKVPELLCLLYASFLEMLILSHLIPSNDNYRELWEAASIGAGIMSQDGEICYKARKSIPVTKEQILEAREHPIFLKEGNMLLKSHQIQSAVGYWFQDISEINRLNRELSEIGNVLEEENALLEAANKMEAEQAQIEEKNRLYDAMAKQVSPQLATLSNILENMPEDDKNFEDELKYACVLNAYIKRSLNLQLMADQSDKIDSREFTLAVTEFLGYVKMCGIQTFFSSKGSGMVPGKEVLKAFAKLEEALEKYFSHMDGILVYAEISDSRFLLRMEIDSGEKHVSVTYPEGGEEI